MLLISLIFAFSNTSNIYGQEKLTKNIKSDASTPIFEIKNDLNQTVFAVYPGGVRIFIDESTEKAAGGGFTVGRLNTGKATAGDIFSVVPNNVNVYIDDATGAKAAGGGFTVGRLNTGKADGDPENFLQVTSDSTRVYIDESSSAGFAVGKLGTAETGLQNFMYLRKDNYFIGHNSGKLTTGLFNLFLGYESGFSNTTGQSNTFLGHRTGYSNDIGENNVFIGKEAGYSNIGSDFNTYIGYQAGYNATSNFNTAVGYQAGYSQIEWQAGTFLGYLAGKNTTGRQNVFLGAGSGFAFSTGGDNVCIGAGSGGTNDFTSNEATGAKNVFIGYYTGYESAAGAHNVILGAQSPFGSTQIIGSNNVYIGEDAGNQSGAAQNNIFIGYNAGLNETLSNKLYIDNSSTPTPLIYGDFFSEYININGKLNVSDNIGSWVTEFKNEGNSINRFGVKIQAGTNDTSGLNYMIGFYDGDGNYEGAITLNDGSLALVQNSDKRLKENIINTKINALGIINNLRVVDFNYIKNKNTSHTGYIAQEALEVFPNMVSYNKEHDIYGVTPSELIPVLHKAIQEQQKQIEELKEKNKLLSKQVSEIDLLKAEMNELKAMVKEIAGTEKESKNISLK